MSNMRDMLLVLSNYPDPTPPGVIDQAVTLAKSYGAKLSAVTTILERSKMTSFSLHESWLLDVPSLVEEAMRKSAGDAKRLLAKFQDTAKSAGVYADAFTIDSSFFVYADPFAAHARVCDLVILPVPEVTVLDVPFMEDMIFGAGRPVLLLPATGAAKIPERFDTVVIAWDGSRAAARAVGDAMPILEAASTVRVVTAINEKDLGKDFAVDGIRKHLLAHGISAAFDEVDASHSDIGSALERYTSEHHADLLVMGAFGHSRLREFVLGGATRSMLRKPPLPVLLSH